MHRTLRIIGFAAVLGAAACSHGNGPGSSGPGEQEHNEPNAPPTSAAKLTKDEAVAIALAKFPGEVVESELEREHGHLIYSIEIRPTGQAKGVKEVNVDAIDGSIVNIEDEDEGDGDRDGGGDEGAAEHHEQDDKD